MHPTQKPVIKPVGTTVTDGSDWSPVHTLRSVALYLDRHGWIQGAYYDLDTPGSVLAPAACVLGGIGICVYGHAVEDPEAFCSPESDAFHDAKRALIDYLDGRGELGDSSVAGWNDKLGRTVDQVIQVCRDAADGYDRRNPTGGAA